VQPEIEGLMVLRVQLDQLVLKVFREILDQRVILEIEV
jgi:hypothetical protein